MDPLELLREKFVGFPGYDGDLDRRRSDEFVRAYLGEALTELAARCGELPPELQQRVDALKLRMEFADPQVVRDAPARFERSCELRDDGKVAEEDVAAVELADRASATDCGSVARYSDDVTATLDSREAAMRATATKP